MSLRFHNTLTQKLENFEPIVPGTARIYLCGLTTYHVAHAGHARTMTTFDVLVRHLRARGLKVTYVRNVTDVDDKILKKAAEAGEDPLAYSAARAKEVDLELKSIGCLKPDHEPKVSTHIPEIIALIEKLIEKGFAYVADTPKGKDVYFSVRSFPAYGKLSHRNIDDLLSGARIETGDIKRDPLDFALWKGEVEGGWGWPSPWGQGRPGWHIECSAMAGKYLGEHFDIHCGGTDLIFPHHENEIAQSEAIYGPELARMWIHGGFLNADNEKMSQSLGNFVTIRDVLARNDAEAFRYYLLGTKYGQQLAFELDKSETGRITFTGVDEAERRMDYLYTTRDALVTAAAGAEPELGNVLQGQAKVVEEAPIKVLAALDKDLNTPVALSVIGELAKAANEIVLQIAKLKKDKAAWDSARQLAAKAVLSLDGCCAPLGLMQASSEHYNTRSLKRRLKIRGLDESVINAKVQARIEARGAKDFARADAIRGELTAMGVELLDASGGGTAWKIVA